MREISLFILLVLLFFIGCNEKENSDENCDCYEQPVMASFIGCYLTHMKSVDLTWSTAQRGKMLDVLVKGETVVYPSPNYIEISELYGDVSFNSRDWLPANIEIFASPINMINIYYENRDNEWISINDQIIIHYQSYLPFIESGYDWNTMQVDFSKRLVDFNTQTTSLFSQNFTLTTTLDIFPSLPCKIVICTVDGQTINAIIDP